MSVIIKARSTQGAALLDNLVDLSKIAFYTVGVITLVAHLLTVVYRAIKIHEWRAKRRAKKPKSEMTMLRKRLAKQRKTLPRY